jgi:hypothetical protein
MTRLSTPAETTLTFRHDARAERGVPVAGHVDRHRPDVRDQRLGSLSVTGVAACGTGPFVTTPAEMGVHLTLQRGLQEPLGQLLQQTTLTQQRHTLPTGLLGQTRHRRIVEHPSQQLRTGRLAGGRIDRCLTLHVHHGCHQNTLSV